MNIQELKTYSLLFFFFLAGYNREGMVWIYSTRQFLKCCNQIMSDFYFGKEKKISFEPMHVFYITIRLEPTFWYFAVNMHLPCNLTFVIHVSCMNVIYMIDLIIY